MLDFRRMLVIEKENSSVHICDVFMAECVVKIYRSSCCLIKGLIAFYWLFLDVPAFHIFSERIYL